MPKIKITQRGIESLVRKPHDKQIDYTDSITPGLAFRMGPRGGTWYFLRRIDGRLYRISLERWPTMGIAEARTAVGDLEEAIAEGRHPKAEVSRKRSDAVKNRSLDNQRMIEAVATVRFVNF